MKRLNLLNQFDVLMHYENNRKIHVFFNKKYFSLCTKAFKRRYTNISNNQSSTHVYIKKVHKYISKYEYDISIEI